jgi:hypothetical protein
MRSPCQCRCPALPSSLGSFARPSPSSELRTVEMMLPVGPTRSMTHCAPALAVMADSDIRKLIVTVPAMVTSAARGGERNS